MSTLNTKPVDYVVYWLGELIKHIVVNTVDSIYSKDYFQERRFPRMFILYGRHFPAVHTSEPGFINHEQSWQ